MTPGDAWVDPIIKRGEELERLMPTLTGAELAVAQDEHRSIKEYAQSKLNHLRAFPLANTSQEESAQYLVEQQKRDCDEFEGLMRSYLTLLGEAALKAIVARVLP